MDYNVPADVPDEMVEEYIANMNAATAGTGKMNLFACDQKIRLIFGRSRTMRVITPIGNDSISPVART